MRSTDAVCFASLVHTLANATIPTRAGKQVRWEVSEVPASKNPSENPFSRVCLAASQGAETA
jgi:hypothetical protein